MKLRVLSVREIIAVISLFCLSVLFAPLTRAQNSFTYPPFPTTNGSPLQWNGNATITGGVLQLTPATGSQVGSAWYTNPGATPTPAPLSLVNGFTSTFTFQFTGQGGITNGAKGSNGKTGADGIAFVVQNGCFSNSSSNCGVSALNPDVGTGGEIGFAGLTKSVAVQFDTWCNSEYNDTCAATSSPTSADQLTIESCGTNANMVNHDAGCQFETVDLSRLNSAIFLGDGAVHTAQVTYVPPANPTAGTCPIGSTSATPGCGTLTVVVDGQSLLVVPFNLAYLGLDATDDAYVGFTGATGGAFENQDVLSWTFGVTVVQPFNTSGPTTANFSSNGNENQLTLDATGTGNSLICKGQPGNSCANIELITTNDAIPTAIWPQYVVGGPWAPSICAARLADGANTCTLYVNACYGGTAAPPIPLSAASDFYCPAVDPTVMGATPLTIEDVFDPPSPKLNVAPGTTVSLLDFTPSSPTEIWAPSSISPTLVTNPVCTNPFEPAFQCDVADTLLQVFGDQTTTKGSKPKKGWIVTVFNVPMLETTWQIVPGGSCPTTGLPVQLNTPGSNTNPAANLWFNGNCLVSFTVYPAAAPTPNTNGFVAAPPASITYGLYPAVTPNPSDTQQTNSSLGSPAQPWPLPLGTLSSFISSIGGGGDGKYILHWSAQDLVGNSEKFVQLLSDPDDPTNASNNNDIPCPNPTGDPKIPGFPTPTQACYATNLFSTTLNIDSHAPTFAAPCSQVPSSPNSNGWYNTDITFSCSAVDPTPGSGIGPQLSSGQPTVPAGQSVPFTLMTSIGSGNWSSDANTNTQQYCDLASNCTVFQNAAIVVNNTVPPGFKIDEIPPTISAITLNPTGGVYTVGEKVTASFTCGDVGSGVASCLGTGGVASGGFISTSTTGPQTFTVTATDIAGNTTTSSINYTVNAPSADVALFETANTGTPKHGTSLTYTLWALDLSTNSASNVTITATMNLPAGVLGSGGVSAIAGIVECNLFTGCKDITTGTSCSVGANNTVTCTIGTLPSVFKLAGAVVKIVIPISSTATPGSKFTVTGTVTSANDPNPRNNSASQTFTVK
jgi:hypothetical protein